MTGKGVTGRHFANRIALGNAALMSEVGANIESLAEKVEALRNSGRTVMFLAVDGLLAGAIAVGDPIKDSTRGALDALRADGLALVMLTGDARGTAQAVAKSLGIDEVVAEVQPADKARIVERLQSEGRRVAMAGDATTTRRGARRRRYRDGHRHGHRHGERAGHAGEGRSDGIVQARNSAARLQQHLANLCLLATTRWNSDRRGNPLPGDGIVAVAHARRARDEPLFGLSDQQRVAITGKIAAC